MNAVPDELVAALEELSGEDDDGGGAVSDFAVLDLRQLDEHFGGGVSDLKLLEDGGAVVRDGDITDVIDKHLVEALRPERCLDNV